MYRKKNSILQIRGFMRYYDRALPFERTIAPEHQDRQLARRIIHEEMSGVLNWALLGYKRLMGAGVFTVPASSDESLSDYRRQTDPLIEFVEEMVDFRTGYHPGVTVNTAHAAYKKWCQESNHHPLGRSKFREAMERRLGVKATRTEDGYLIPGIMILNSS